MNSVLWVRQISKYNFNSGWDFHWGICRYRGKVIVQPPRILWGDYAHKRSWWKLNQMEINGMRKKHNLIIGTQFRSWYIVLVAVQSLSHVWLFVIPWTAAPQAALSFAISWSLLKHMSIESVMTSNHLVLCCPLLLFLSICISEVIDTSFLLNK